MDYEKKCLLKMTRDALIIANSGQPFSRLGVISICASHRGTKRKEQPIDLFNEWMDSDLPKAIREKEIETYLWDKNRLFDDYNQEREVSFDYGGRFLLELLQNADDAMCPVDTPPSDLIGIKGLGFKSVLEITNKPAIYSDPFHFYFSATDSQRLLQERGINESPPLTFRIPHDNNNIEDILDLVDEYPTIISLPFKNEIAQKKVERELNNLSVFFLLLSQHIKSVEVVWPDGRNRLWRIERDSAGELKDGDIYVEVIKDELVQDTYKFRRWAHIWSPEGVGKRHSVASCLPLSSTGEVQALEETFPLYSFFPTEEFLPFRALFHASFDLDQSRKHVRDPDNKDILGHLEMLLGRIVADIPAEISLKAFFPKDKPNEKTIAYTLWDRFESVLRQKEFVSCIGGKKVAPPKARLWKYNLGNVLRPDEIEVMEKFLVEPKLLRDNDLRKALVHLGAEPLEDEMYLTLLRYCKNENRDDCQKAFKAFFVIIKELVKYFPYQKDKYYLNICRKIPCWWIADGSARSLFNQLPFLRKEPELSLPNWLQFDVLDHEFLAYLNEIESKDNNPPQIWNKILSGRLLNDKRDELLNHFLVPTIEAKKEKDWWEQHGGEALHVYQLWTKGLDFKGSPVAIWNDKNRKGIGNSLFLPTDKGWLPSWQCYAGKSWGAPEFFDTFFSDITDRGVLKEPDQWPVDIEENEDHWKKILRYAGVSWEMKLIYKSVPDYKGWEIRRQSVSWWTKCPFPPSLIQEKDWSEYLSSLVPPDFNRRTQFDWDTKIHEQWGIEFFPDALPKNPMDRLKVIKPIAKEAKDNRMKYSFQKGAGWPGRNTGQVKSFASWQIEDFSWLSCKQSLLDNRLTVPPDKAYMPGKGIGGLLPEINIKIPEGQEGRDIVTFLTQILGVRETLPLSGEMIWKEWIEKLPSAAQRTMDHDVAIRATRMLYRSFFDIHDEKPEWFDETYDIPCLKWDKDGKSEQLGFNSSSDIYWLDKPYLAEPNTRIELLHRFNIFILEQEQGKEAAVWCEIKPLSTIVHVEPHFYTKDQKTTNIIQKRYDERYNSLKVVSGLANLPNPTNLKILAVDNLRLRIIKEEQIISAPRVRSWKENGLILLDRARKWEALGLALVQEQTRKDLSNTFENLLRARDGREVLQRLRDLGVPESAIEDLENDFQGTVISDIVEPDDRTATEEKMQTEDINDSRNIDTSHETGSTQENFISDEAIPEQEERHIKDTTSSGIVSQSRRKKGEDAENWIRSRISDLLSISNWAVSSQSERDHLNRESDIVLSHPTFGKYHIEVKHVEAGEIFWSEREVSKAKDNKDNYWMVVARPGYAEDSKKIIWFWDPLEDLQNLPRRGKWFWRKETDDPEIAITGWDVPAPRKREDATYFTFVIKVSNKFLDNFRLNTSRGLMCLTEKLNQIK
jgi:hypothetical protein